MTINMTKSRKLLAYNN